MLISFSQLEGGQTGLMTVLGALAPVELASKLQPGLAQIRLLAMVELPVYQTTNLL